MYKKKTTPNVVKRMKVFSSFSFSDENYSIIYNTFSINHVEKKKYIYPFDFSS